MVLGFCKFTTNCCNEAITEEMFDELWNLDWVGIPDTPYVMKCKFDEDGYKLLISNLTSVYGEKLYGSSLQERFQALNPHAEMFPNTILKHVKQSIQKISAGIKTEFKITFDSNKVNIQYQFSVSGVNFIFESEPHMLSDIQFKALILRPILLRSIIVDAQKAALQTKNEEFQGQDSCSSSGYSERKNIKAIYSEIKENNSLGSGIIRAFLYLQKYKLTLPENLEDAASVSPTKVIPSSTSRIKQPLSFNKIKDSKLATRNMLYKEGDSEVSFESENIIQPSISVKTEKIKEDSINTNEFDNLNADLSGEDVEETALQMKKVSYFKKKKLMKF